MAKPTLTNFRADALRELRIRKGLSQEAVAEQVGVSSWTYRQWETGRATPLAGRLSRLADVVGGKVADLVGTPHTLADYRVLAGLSQADLAKLIDVSRATVAGWEQGLTPVAVKHHEDLRSVLPIPVSEPPPWQDTLPPTAHVEVPPVVCRPRSDTTDWEHACASVTAILAAEGLEGAEQRPAPPPATVQGSWVNDRKRFQTAYREARKKRPRANTPPMLVQLPYHSDEEPWQVRAFAVQIEFDFPASMSLPDRHKAIKWIGDELHTGGVTDSPTPRGARSTPDRDDHRWLFETSGALIGGEVTSPNSRSGRRFWDQLLHVCFMINNYQGKASRRAGCHITVWIEGHEHTIVRHENLLRGIRNYEDLLYRLGQNIPKRRHRQPPGSTPAPKHGRGYQPVTTDQPTDPPTPTRPMRVHYAHTRLASGDRIKFRLWDSTLSPGAIQAQIKLSVGMIEKFSTRPWTQHNWVGKRFARNRDILRRRPGARLRAEDWQEDTHPLRELADLLYPDTPADREELAVLFANTRWNPRPTGTRIDAH